MVIHFTWETVFRHIYGSRFGRLITVNVDGREAELTGGEAENDGGCLSGSISELELQRSMWEHL